MGWRRHQSWGLGQGEIDTPLENLGCRPLRWPIRRAEAPLRICNFSRCLERRGRRKAHIREARESWRGGRPSQFYERRLRLTRSQGRSEPCHCRPRPTHDQEEWTNCARACVRAWYGRLYIISSFPRPQGCRRRTLRTRKRGLESPPAAGAVSLPLSARFFFCARLVLSLSLFRPAQRCGTLSFLLSVPQSPLSFISWPCAAQLPTFKSEEH